jgi:hypothetical protein
MPQKIFESKRASHGISPVTVKITTMRTILNKLAAAALLSFLAVSPLLAQTTAPIGDTNRTTAYSEAVQQQKLESDRQLASDQIMAQRQIATSKMDNHRLIIHDLAWNSWVLFVIAIFFFGYLKDKRRHETIRLMIEKGTPVTPEILDGLRKKSRLGARTYDPQGHLCWGITEVFVAVALMISFQAGAGRTAAWIVLAVGVANLILWFIGRAHSSGGQSK